MNTFLIRAALIIALALTSCRAPKPVLLNRDMDTEEKSAAALQRDA